VWWEERDGGGGGRIKREKSKFRVRGKGEKERSWVKAGGVCWKAEGFEMGRNTKATNERITLRTKKTSTTSIEGKDQF